MKIECQNCERRIEVTQEEWDESNGTCKECDGSFEEVEEINAPNLPHPISPIALIKEEPVETKKFNPEEKTEFD